MGSVKRFIIGSVVGATLFAMGVGIAAAGDNVNVPPAPNVKHCVMMVQFVPVGSPCPWVQGDVLCAPCVQNCPQIVLVGHCAGVLIVNGGGGCKNCAPGLGDEP